MGSEMCIRDSINGDRPDFASYRLAAVDRRFGNLFLRFKSAMQRDVSETIADINPSQRNGRPLFSRILATVGGAVLATGIWELVFRVRVSDEMREFIGDFKPDLVLAQGFDLAFTELPVLIHKEFGIPIMTSLVDDWEPTIYRFSPDFLGVRRAIKTAFMRLVECSDARYCISSDMAREFRLRYGSEFDVLMQHDYRKVVNCGKAKSGITGKLVVAYSGSLGLRRWEGLRDLADALKALSQDGVSWELHVYAPSFPVEASVLLRYPQVKLMGHLADADVLTVLAAADIVFLPESFDQHIRDYIRLSISTKAHLYMMTGSVPLVYGPPELGTVRYATQDGWGVVVDRPDIDALRNAVRSIVKDQRLRDHVVSTALNVFNRNHSPSAGHILDFYKRRGG